MGKAETDWEMKVFILQGQRLNNWEKSGVDYLGAGPLWIRPGINSWLKFSQLKSNPTNDSFMYPFQVKGKMIMNSVSLFAAISGIILLIMDIFNITVSRFLKMESLDSTKGSVLPIDIHNCEPTNPSEKPILPVQYCYRIRSVFLVSVKFDFFSERKCGIFIMRINSRSRLSASGTYCLMALGKNFNHILSKF